jgi:DNA-binding NtrC family response regulator
MKRRGKVFLVDDDALIVSMLSRALKNEGYEIRGETAQFNAIADAIGSWSPDVVFLDLKLPGTSGVDILQEIKARGLGAQVIMLTSDDSLETAVKCMKLGAVDYLTKPFNIDEVKIVVANFIEKESLKLEVNYLRKVYEEVFEKEIIGVSGALMELKTKIERIARSRVPSILVTGESGTGKELVARCLHRAMNQAAEGGYAPFIAVNCSALPESLLESELFGYEKGAFTDAKSDKKGIFELANGGTMLLDEIGEMKLDLQSKLLRVLEERTVRRIGGQGELPIDVTVIATTNRDLAEGVEQGDFRKDLFYRLNTFALHVPPLRERKEDIPLLTRYFLVRFAERYKNKTLRGISREAENLLSAYSWPGNVRELKNVIERIVVLESGEMILPEHLPKEIFHLPEVKSGTPDKRYILPDGGVSLDDLEKDLIVQALERAKQNKTLAARLLNISYDSLRYQIKKLGLEA